MNKTRLLIREYIYKLLENSTISYEGDKVLTKDGEGVIRLPKHPFYSVTIDDTGVTNSYHYTDIEVLDKEYGKYELEDDENLQESSNEDIIKLHGVLILKDGEHMNEVLSSIRSIEGVTVVRNEDIDFDTTLKSKLHIKIDPYPFNNMPIDNIEKLIIRRILYISGVRSFQKIKEVINNPQTRSQYQKQPPTPVKSIEDLQEKIKIRFKIRP